MAVHIPRFFPTRAHKKTGDSTPNYTSSLCSRTISIFSSSWLVRIFYPSSLCGSVLTSPTDKRNDSVSFDEIDYSNYSDLRKAQESMIREQWIRINALKVCRKALEKCYKQKGVNHFEDCRDLAERYMQMMDTQGRVDGFYGYQKNDPSK